jgi:hypothetical protein
MTLPPQPDKINHNAVPEENDDPQEAIASLGDFVSIRSVGSPRGRSPFLGRAAATPIYHHHDRHGWRYASAILAMARSANSALLNPWTLAFWASKIGQFMALFLTMIRLPVHR